MNDDDCGILFGVRDVEAFRQTPKSRRINRNSLWWYTSFVKQ